MRAPSLTLALLSLAAMSWAGVATAGKGAAPAARPTGVPGEVLLVGAADVTALCEELRADDREAREAIYVMALPAGSWSFAAYDKRRARLAVDLGKGVRPVVGAWELALGRQSGPALDVAVPVAPKEAAQLIQRAKASELKLWLWFRTVPVAGQERACLEVHGKKGAGVRLGIEPLAFVLAHQQQPVAAGETPAFTAMRPAHDEATGDEPAVVVGAAMLTSERGAAPAAVSEAMKALAPSMLACYRKGLDETPELAGTLVLGVVVKADGRVASARAEIDGLGAPAVAACVSGAVSAARFPAGALRFSVPVRFE